MAVPMGTPAMRAAVTPANHTAKKALDERGLTESRLADHGMEKAPLTGRSFKAVHELRRFGFAGDDNALPRHGRP